MRIRAVPGGNGRRPDRLRGKSVRLQLRRDVKRPLVRAENHRNDVRGARAKLQTARGQRSAQQRGYFAKMRALRVRLLRQLERRSNLSGEVGRHRRAENKRARAIDEKLPQRAPAAHERPGACQRLSAGVHDGQHFLLASASAAIPRPCGPQTPVACASSTITFGAILARQIAKARASGATSPSMLKTLSVTITFAPGASSCSRSAFSRNARSQMRIDNFLSRRRAACRRSGWRD